jgi:predicted phage-related endonuclease
MPSQLVREGIFLPRTEELEETRAIEPWQFRIAPLNEDGTTDMDAWRQQRASDGGIGASEVATIMGTEMQSRGSKYALYHKLKGGYKPEEVDAEAQQRFDLGHLMENTATAYFMSKNREIGLIDPESCGLRDHLMPKLVASVDRVAFLEQATHEDGSPPRFTDVTLTKQWIPVEIKNVGEFMKEDWTSNSIPDHYYDQVQAQLLVTGKPCALVIGFFGGQKITIYTVQADQERIALMREKILEFLMDLLLDREPQPDGTEACTRVVKDCTREGVPKKVIQADEELISLVYRHRSEDEIAEEAKKSAIEQENKIRLKMGDAVKATHPLFTVLYSIVKADSAVVDEETAAEDTKVIEARQALADLMEEAKKLANKVTAAKAIESDALAPYTTIVNGNTRRLLIKWAK